MPIKTPLRRLRERRKKTLQEVADAIGTDTGNLSRIEQGKQRSLPLAEKLVAFFGPRAIDEAQILYPERYLPPKGRRKERADVPEPVRG